MNEKKYPEPIEALLVILIIFGIIFASTLAMAVVMMISNQTEEATGLAKYVYVLGALPYLIIPVLYARFRKYEVSELFRFRKVPPFTVLLSIIIGLAISVVGDELDRIVQIFLPLPEFILEQLKSMKADTFSDWIWLLIGVVLFAAVSEEMVFRGFLQVALEKKGDATRAVMLTSLAWTFIHVNPYWFIQIFIMGVVIGFLAWQTDSIIPGIIVHGVNNFLSLLYINFEPELDWYTAGDHVAPLVLIPAIALLVYGIKLLSDFYRSQDV